MRLLLLAETRQVWPRSPSESPAGLETRRPSSLRTLSPPRSSRTDRDKHLVPKERWPTAFRPLQNISKSAWGDFSISPQVPPYDNATPIAQRRTRCDSRCWLTYHPPFCRRCCGRLIIGNTG